MSIAPTQSQVQTALVSFLASVLPAGVEIVEGQDNRVPEPTANDFIVIWPIRDRRLSTNVDTYDPTNQTETFTEGVESAVQMDVHGPNSSENARLCSMLLRDEYAVNFFAGANAAVTPLHADDPRQIPFLNDQQQIEFRWIVEALLQVNASTTLTMQSATVATVTTISV